MIYTAVIGRISLGRNLIATLLTVFILTACQQQVVTPQINVEALREQRCLASVIHYEAIGESIKGQKAVADVVLNRAVKSGKSVCETIAEPRQFAWYSKNPLLPLDSDMRKLLTNVASERTITTSEYYFFSGNKPVWSRQMICRKLERHTFCREKLK